MGLAPVYPLFPAAAFGERSGKLRENPVTVRDEATQEKHRKIGEVRDCWQVVREKYEEGIRGAICFLLREIGYLMD